MVISQLLMVDDLAHKALAKLSVVHVMVQSLQIALF